jgi:Tfp pilus assembly protein PilF
MKRFIPLLLLSFLAPMIGCQGNQAGTKADYETLAEPPNRNTDVARSHNIHAVSLMGDGILEKAEQELKAALSADMFYGPSHNNLGIVYFRQKKYYLAAWEFQYAVKLMPNEIEPLNNLGLVFEAVGRLDDAEKWYDKALSLKPEATDVVGNLARVRIRCNKKDEATQKLLSNIVLKDRRPEWVSWARQQLACTTNEGLPSPDAPKNGEKTISEELK